MGNFLFGSAASRVNNATPPATGLRVQSAVAGKPIPIGWGRARLSGNIIDYDDFVAIPHESSPSGGGGKGGGGGGGGGKGGGSGSTTYTYQANFLIGLAEGTVNNLLTVWNNKTSATPASLNIGAFGGSYTQTAWSTWSSLHP